MGAKLEFFGWMLKTYFRQFKTEFIQLLKKTLTIKELFCKLAIFDPEFDVNKKKKGGEGFIAFKNAARQKIISVKEEIQIALANSQPIVMKLVSPVPEKGTSAACA